RWSAKAAENNGAFGLCNLASLEMRKRNFEKGRFLFDEAHLHSNLLRLARAEDAVAIFCLGLIEMESPPRNAIKAVRYFEQSSRKGFAPAQALLGMIKLNGIGIPRDQKEGIKWSKAAARAGSPYGKFQLGMAYSIGEGVEFDQAKSMELIRAAAEQGLGSAQLTLGMKYANGEGVEHDYAQAAEWLKKASKQGIGEATFQLRRCETMLKHQTSIVVKPVKPTEPGETVAKTPPLEPVKTPQSTPVPVPPSPSLQQEMLIRLQQARHLLLVERKISEAKVILKELSAEGVTEAQRLLGIAHYRSRDYQDAHTLFLQAAQKSDPQAQRYLGMIYFLGQGVERDYAQANVWLGKAAVQGDQEASRYRDILQKFYKE
ncbi:MAG: tetratricopeptide repeat protein, partial [Opitutales bacterium]